MENRVQWAGNPGEATSQGQAETLSRRPGRVLSQRPGLGPTPTSIPPIQGLAGALCCPPALGINQATGPGCQDCLDLQNLKVANVSFW